MAYVGQADRVGEDHYLVAGHAVDLADELETCSCGNPECFAVVASLVHQARHHRAAA